MASQGGPIQNGPRVTDGIWPSENKIVIGVDIGATHSGVAFTYLIKGQKPKIHRIQQWPGQTDGRGSAKIPTVVWYDDNKKAVSFGADAVSRDQEEAQKQGWTLAKEFKLHLQPVRLRKKFKLEDLNERLPPLPKIYSDFLGYIFEQTKICFEDRIIDGKSIWEKYMSTMQIVIGHPNGWSNREQAFLRNAAVKCGVFNTSQSTIAKNISFVTEAEASVHYCIQHTNLSTELKPGSMFAVCDAGGSTVDTTLYSVISTEPDLQLKEVRTSASIQAGAIFVNRAFEALLNKWMSGLGLSGGKEEVDEYTEAGVQDFESVKRKYDHNDSDSAPKIRIKVAGRGISRGKNTDSHKIHRGYVEVSSYDVKECFDECVKPIISNGNDLLGDLSVSHLLLVGGFGDNPYLRSALKKKHEGNIQITLANESTSKAVADGAVFWGIARNVFARAPYYSYGIICSRPCLPWIEELDGRDISLGPGGVPFVSGAWSPIVQKGIPLDLNKVYRENYTFISKNENPGLVTINRDLHAYAGDGKPKWGLDNNGDLMAGFHKVGVIKAEIWNLEGALKYEEGLLPGLGYWEMGIDVCLQFGGTELHGWIEWKQNGITRTTEATLVPWDPIV